MAAKSKAKTGSAKLGDEGRGFPAASLRTLVTVLKKHKLDKAILIKGIPKPDFINGRFTTKDATAVTDVLRALIKVGGTFKGIKILPNGQPPVIDVIAVEIPGIRA
jgi:hypothetical protein